MEDAGAEVSDEGALDEAVPEMGNQIGGNRVGADDHKRPRPALPAPDAIKKWYFVQSTDSSWWMGVDLSAGS